jgi:hypothetical protein
MALAPPSRDIASLERPREQFAEPLWRRSRAPVDEQARAAMLHEQLTATAAWGERVPVARCHAHGYQPTVAPADQGRDEPAFGAERQAERGVLDIAPAHHRAVLAEPGGADAQP